MTGLGRLLVVASAAVAALASLLVVPLAASADDGLLGGAGKVVTTVTQGDGGDGGRVVQTVTGIPAAPAPVQPDPSPQVGQSAPVVPPAPQEAPAGPLLDPALGLIQPLTPVLDAVTVPVIETPEAVVGTVESVPIVGPVLAPVLDLEPVLQGVSEVTEDLLGSPVSGPVRGLLGLPDSQPPPEVPLGSLGTAPDRTPAPGAGSELAAPSFRAGPARADPEIPVDVRGLASAGPAGVPAQPVNAPSRSARQAAGTASWAQDNAPATDGGNAGGRAGIFGGPAAFVAGLAAPMQAGGGSQLPVAYLAAMAFGALLLASWRLSLATGGPPEQPVFLLAQPPR